MRELIDDFLRRRPKLREPHTAASQCRIANTDLADELARADVAAEQVWVRGHRTQPTRAAPRALLADRHMLLRLPGGVFVDVTRRQFEPACGHPRYYSSEADLSADWRYIDDGPPDGGVADERWRELGLPAWEPGVEGKGLLVARGPLHCWALDAEAAPHHLGAMRTLELTEDQVEAYLTVRENGTVRFVPESTPAATARVLTLDSRLRVESDTESWQFG